jgi:hypothetical protein
MAGDNNLHKAAHKGDLEECKKYVEGIDGEDMIDVNEPGASDRRALHRSAGAGHLALCEYFVEKLATIDLVRKLIVFAVLFVTKAYHCVVHLL